MEIKCFNGCDRAATERAVIDGRSYNLCNYCGNAFWEGVKIGESGEQKKQKNRNNAMINQISNNIKETILLEEKMKNLQERCQKLNTLNLFEDMTLTSKHRDRINDKAIDAITDHKHGATAEYANVKCDGGRYYFEFSHHITNGIGTLDRIELPSFDSLSNLIDVLEKIQNDK